MPPCWNGSTSITTSTATRRGSGIFTPSDYSFPHDGIAAEATPNTETVLVADLDLSLLKELHVHGSVRNLADRRRDLYDLALTRRPAGQR